MSTKTMKQRIAVVAVSALTAGFLSVVAAPVANAAVPAASTLFVASTATTTGSAVNADNDQANMKSLGWIARTSANATAAGNGFTLTSGTETAVVYSGAKIAFSGKNAAAANSGIGFVVTGGTLSGMLQAATSDTIALNGTSTTAVAYDADNTAEDFGGVFNISAAVGSTATLQAYVGTGIAGTATATNGALIGQWVFTVSSSSTVQVYSASKSTITSQVAIAKGATPSTVLTYDNTDLIANGSVGYIYVALKDALSSAILAASTTSLTATTSAGTIIGHATAASANSYAATGTLTVITPADAGIYYVVVNQPVANTAGTATVNISLDGAVIATKTLKWAGDIATLAVDTVNSASTFIDGATATSPATAMGNVVYVAKDAAGNAVTLGAQPTVDSPTGALVGASVYNGNTLASGGVYQTASAGYGATTMVLPSGLQGAATYRLKLTNAVGTSIYSAVQTVKVSLGGPNSFAASWDKASYAPGDIAVLTITVKDAYGNPVGSGTALPGLTAGLIVSTAGFTSVGGACVDASYTDSAGVKTCKFAAGNTEGAYSFNVDLTTVAPQSATVGSIKIAATSAVVSNADVLKSIVALIASINKQIQALQKLILARR